MSTIYNTEPPPTARVVLTTTSGDLEIELWAKETPLASRNFIQLCLEGYYDNVSFHRLVPGFIIQGGDQTGTGTGGESIYGAPFADEPHQRLKFNRRGLLACANEGDRDTNGSQFFFTLDATPELQSRHTLFGRISGPSIYNLLSLASVEVEPGTDTPIHLPRVKSARVVEEPWGDIVPRITAEERRAQEKARKAAKKARKEREGDKKGTKNTALLSFGEVEATEDTLKGPKSLHDLVPEMKAPAAPVPEVVAPITASASASKGKGKEAAVSSDAAPRKSASSSKQDASTDLAGLRAREASKQTAAQVAESERIAALEASIRGSDRPSSSSADKEKKKKAKSALAEMRDAYAAKASGKSDKGKRKEKETVELLEKFKESIRAKEQGASEKSKGKEREKSAAKEVAQDEEDEEKAMREYGASDDDDDDTDWRSHRLDAGGVVQGDKHDIDEYVTLDPRAPDAASRAFGEQASGGVSKSARDGKRGREWVETRAYAGDEKRTRRDDDRAREDRRGAQRREEPKRDDLARKGGAGGLERVGGRW